MLSINQLGKKLGLDTQPNLVEQFDKQLELEHHLDSDSPKSAQALPVININLGLQQEADSDSSNLSIKNKIESAHNN